MSSSRLPICWSKENVGKAISVKAKVDDKQAHYLLACHSPMAGIQEYQSEATLTEEDLFQRVTSSSQRDKQVVIFGEPGTGKSHLIHWLKLRYDYAVDQAKMQDVVPVLIQRRTGSLKDALTQLIEQLGEGFRKYLDPVQTALEKLSDDTARQMLANELSLELGPRWKDRGREPITKNLKQLGQACRSEGFSGWLCREGGVIDRKIKLLTQASDVIDRENSLEFSSDDLLVVGSRFTTVRNNSQEVHYLIEELIDKPHLREAAAEHLNLATRDAIVGMVGLSGANLRTIFDSIRMDLADQGKHLALFIEDVSAMAELDLEIVNALEPQDRMDLCPLTAVIGMTHIGFQKLRDSQSQRLEFVYQVDGDTVVNWANDKDALAKFMARYLNAVRLEEGEVRTLAEQRRTSNGDVRLSKCEDCKFKSQCHNTFGFVSINDTEIGLYPFSPETAPRVLKTIRSNETSWFSATQRGLLMSLLNPILSDTNSLENGQFPSSSTLPLRISDPYFWTEFQQNYLGNYSAEDKQRLLMLAGLWIEPTDVGDEAAAQLHPFLAPLGLPDFAREAPKRNPRPPTGNTSTETKGSPAAPVDDRVKKDIKKYLDALSKWMSGDKLTNESYFRGLLSALLKQSINWANYTQPAQFDSWVKKVINGISFVLVEGQRSSPERLHFLFPRNDETRSLLEALFRFDKEGKKTWNFPLSESHKRTVARWLRKHEQSVVDTLSPGVDTKKALSSAVKFMAFYSIAGERQYLPKRSIAELMNRLLKGEWPVIPTAISEELKDLFKNMADRYGRVVSFVENEISVRQGSTGGKNFMAAHLVAEDALAFQETGKIEDLSEGYFKNHWKPQFQDLPSILSPKQHRFDNLGHAIECECDAIESIVNTVRTLLKQLGFNTEDVKSDVMTLCDQVMTLHETVKQSWVVLPDADLDALLNARVFTEKKMQLANSVSRATQILASPSKLDVLLFDPSELLDAKRVISAVATRIKRLESYVAEQEEDIRQGDDPEQYVAQMFEALTQIAEFKEEDTESTHVKST